MQKSELLVGFGVADITPPVGLAMCGGLEPRINVGTEDPLLAKALVAEAGGRRACIVGVDLIGLPREIDDRIIDAASERTGIDPGAIMVSCSHTHTGPYTIEGLYSFGVTDADYLGTLPDAIASSIEMADAARQPATMHIGRSLVHHGLHHRRVVCKDGKAFNTWMPAALNDLDTCPQVLGSAGPIDPEMWVVRFDDAEGDPLGVFVNFSLHVNSHGGARYSADYPSVIAEYIRETLGPEVVSVFTPGACANINVTRGGATWREGAEWFAEQAMEAAKRAQRVEGPIVVDAVHRDLPVPRRDPETQPAEAIGRLNWGGRGGRADVFDRQVEHIAAMPEELVVPVNAIRMGPLGIASNPGEYFVEHGITIKRRSPFPHTVVAQLTNDLIMYQPTREALEQQGYETLVGPNRVSIEGIEKMTDTAVELLEVLWERSPSMGE